MTVGLIFSQNTDLCEKYVQTLVRRTSSDFKTLRSSLKYSASPCALNVWKSEEVPLTVIELLLRIPVFLIYYTYKGILKIIFVLSPQSCFGENAYFDSLMYVNCA